MGQGNAPRRARQMENLPPTRGHKNNDSTRCRKQWRSPLWHPSARSAASGDFTGCGRRKSLNRNPLERERGRAPERPRHIPPRRQRRRVPRPDTWRVPLFPSALRLPPSAFLLFLLADDFHQHAFGAAAVEFAIEDLLPRAEVELPLVTATTTSRPMTCRFRWASALSSPVRL